MCNTNPNNGESMVCREDYSETFEHSGYPHVGGTLHDCAACENVCHCDPDDVVTMGDERDMCVHCSENNGVSEESDANGFYPEDDYGPYENHGFVPDFDYSTEY